MSNGTPQREIEAALDGFLERVRSPRALTISPGARASLEQAAQRARVQLTGGPQPVLIVAIAGGTGSGKSTLINALAGAPIAEAGQKRPTTTHLRVYHHRDVPTGGGGVPVELGAEAKFIPHDRPELRMKVLVDTPDLDTFATEHRARTKALLKASGLVLYIFSPEKYLDERTWSVIREEQRFSAVAAVLNKADTLSAPDLERVTQHLRERFASIGLDSIRIFRTCALAHASVVGAGGGGSKEDGDRTRSDVDETPALRAFLERELDESDIARMVRAQRRRVLLNLRRQVDAVAPPATLDTLDLIAAGATERAAAAGAAVAKQLTDRLAVAELELAPLAAIRQHERFGGPFRAWLGVADFFQYALADLVGRLLGRPGRSGPAAIERILSAGGADVADRALRAEAQAIQNELYAAGLPVERWMDISRPGSAGGGGSESRGAEVMALAARAVSDQFDAWISARSARRTAAVWLATGLGWLVPAALIGVGLYLMGQHLIEARYVGLSLFGHILGIAILFFACLHGVVGALLPGTSGLARGVGGRAVRGAVGRTITSWVERYSADLRADLSDLHGPIERLGEAALRASEDEDESPPPALARPLPTERAGDAQLRNGRMSPHGPGR